MRYDRSDMKTPLIATCVAVALLLGAGCNPFAQTEEPPEQPQPSTSNPQPDLIEDDSFLDEAPIGSPISQDGWMTYNGAPGFRFQYPAPSDSTSTWNGTDRLTLDLEDRPLDKAWLELDVANSQEEEGMIDHCMHVGGASYVNQMIYLNGIALDECITSDSGAGNTYRTWRYATHQNDWLVVLTFVVQHPTNPRLDERCNDGTFTEAQCEEFDPSTADSLIQEIMQTFEWPVSQELVIRDEVIREDHSTYTIDIRYPVLLNASYADSFNRTIRKDMNDLTEAFKRIAEEPVITPPGPITLTLEPVHLYHEDGILNVLLTGSEYTGGAHPNALYQSYLFDGENRTLITLPEYLETRDELSMGEVVEAARQQLEAHEYLGDDKEWIRTGTEPKPENYGVVALNDQWLTVIFPPYQVGPYAAGPQEVEIPLVN
ncbi:DUF4163 domain-containing protein [Candidatus Uhrbacteria bacterium]|nr:DUF4163 domain-containing protein [Candidatus Uhrbacteria bacterium]MBD3284568.1 DUF4163 domain-containing protein [Candidatus Uhrbacteria bacterium]